MFTCAQFLLHHTRGNIMFLLCLFSYTEYIIQCVFICLRHIFFNPNKNFPHYELSYINLAPFLRNNLSMYLCMCVCESIDTQWDYYRTMSVYYRCTIQKLGYCFVFFSSLSLNLYNPGFYRKHSKHNMFCLCVCRYTRVFIYEMYCVQFGTQ